MVVYQCEDSIESIFTAIYDAYADKCDHADTRISLTDELLLFAEYQKVIPDNEKVRKVIRTLKKRFGEENYMTICFALASVSEEKAQAVYQLVVYGLRTNCGYGHLFDNLANEATHKVFTLARGASNENHHLLGFVRFMELENGIMFSKIGPKNNVLTFMMPHFVDRFPMENFMIYDENRDLFAIHPAGHDWYLISSEEIVTESICFNLSKQEHLYQELFKQFCHTIAIKERRNTKLQNNMMPLRFQEYMIEFQ
ncbi:TIGR03915 family putative DNA repair protein [Lachnospiraceae bacterium OttesenSCG-928-D06]|nr:TIGR03915 family putative DNA repair protein [Lachnospiraceae bacterium OttesenSCG-928-D06]